MDRRLFDIAVLNAELTAKLAIIKWEKKFTPKEKKEQTNGNQAVNPSAQNNPAKAQY